MHITTKAVLAGVVLSLSSGAAFADWEAAKARATAYHDQYGEVPLAHNGELATEFSILGQTRACVVQYSYPGTGTEVDITSASPTPPDNDQSQQMCNNLRNASREVATGGIALPGTAVREIFQSLDDNGIVPELADSDSRSETYSATLDPSQFQGELPSEVQQAAEVQVSVTFAKSDGHVLGAALTAHAEVEETQDSPAMVLDMEGEISFGTVNGGQPYMAGLDFTIAGQATGGDQNIAMNAQSHMSFTNVSEVENVAANTAGAQPTAISAQTGSESLLRTLARELDRAAADAAAGLKAQVKTAK